MKEFLAGIGGIVLVIAAVVGISYGGYIGTAFFAPRYEAIRRDTMIESRAYNEGALRELYTLQVQYLAAKTDEEKNVIAALARHEFSIFPRSRVPDDLRSFLSKVEM